MRALPRYFESSATLAAPANAAFEYLDDHSRLSSHMNESSWKLGGGRMRIESDAAQGRSVGSWIRLTGRVFGLPLSVDEIVTERAPPQRKTWETTDNPRLLIIGPYRMGFEIAARGDTSDLRIFIDYDLPQGPVTFWLGRLLSAYYARWCVRQMVDDSVRHFQATRPRSAVAMS